VGPLEELSEIAGGLENEYTARWKEQGKKVVGYACTYLPEEILYAVDLLPYRLSGRGAQDTSNADAWLSRVNCSFCRYCLELGLTGEYNFLDGAVFTNGCDHIRRTYDNWSEHEQALPFMYILPIPHVLDEDGYRWYKEEVMTFRDSLENHFGVKVMPGKLAAANSVYNQTRRLLRQLYNLQAGQAPPFTGAEMLAVLTAGSRIPKDEYNRLLESLIEEAETRPGIEGRTRLMIAGSFMDDPEFIKNLEGQSAVVVTDTLCMGARSCWDLTKETGDPLEALIRRYYHHASCPRMAGEYKNRLAFVQEQIKLAKVEGVILEHIMFCDLHGTDNALLKGDLEKTGLPVITLERQYGPLADSGRIRTRIQAFLERIGG